jgi:hypothetical protein
LNSQEYDQKYRREYTGDNFKEWEANRGYAAQVTRGKKGSALRGYQTEFEEVVRAAFFDTKRHQGMPYMEHSEETIENVRRWLWYKTGHEEVIILSSNTRARGHIHTAHIHTQTTLNIKIYNKHKNMKSAATARRKKTSAKKNKTTKMPNKDAGPGPPNFHVPTYDAKQLTLFHQKDGGGVALSLPKTAPLPFPSHPLSPQHNRASLPDIPPLPLPSHPIPSIDVHRAMAVIKDLCPPSPPPSQVQCGRGKRKELRKRKQKTRPRKKSRTRTCVSGSEGSGAELSNDEGDGCGAKSGPEEEAEEGGGAEEELQDRRKTVGKYIGKRAKLKVSGWVLGSCQVLGIVENDDPVLKEGKEVEVGYARVDGVKANTKKDVVDWDFTNGENAFVSADGACKYSTMKEVSATSGFSHATVFFVLPDLLHPN